MPKTVRHTPEVVKRVKDVNQAAKRARTADDQALKKHYGQLIKLCQTIDSVWEQLSDQAQKLLADKRQHASTA